MQNEHVGLYVEFLSEFRDAAGPFDAERLEHDAAYKKELIERMLSNVNENLLTLAENVTRDFDTGRLH